MLEFYKPKNNTLARYIEGYYFIAEDRNSEQIRYFTFPNNFCILSVSQNVKLDLKDTKFVITSVDNTNTIANFVSRYTEPIEIIYANAVNEITVYFKPLGINHFVGTTDIFRQNKLEEINLFTDFKEEMGKIFMLKSRNDQINQLEEYWVSKFLKKDVSLAENILSDVEAGLKIEEIARKHNLTRQSINKSFLKFVGKTPSEYRKVHRFRNSISEYKKSGSLTELSHDNLFYDQSHLIKDFRSFTHRSPGSFFKNVDTEKGNVWLFI